MEIKSHKITKVIDDLKDCPCDDPIVHVNAQKEKFYTLFSHVYFKNPVEKIEIKPLKTTEVKTEATPNGQAVHFTFACTIDGGFETSPTYSLWAIEVKYELDDGIDLPFVFVDAEVKYTNGLGPETTRGTVTTPKDPDNVDL